MYMTFTIFFPDHIEIFREKLIPYRGQIVLAIKRKKKSKELEIDFITQIRQCNNHYISVEH